MVHVLQIGLGAGYGGIANCVLNYYEHIDKENFRFDFVDMYGRGLSCAEKIRSLGGKIYTLKNYKRNPIGAYRDLLGILNREPFDVIHINLPTAGNFIPVLAAYFCKKDLVIIVHAHSSGVPKYDFLRKIMHKIGKCFLARISVEKWACSMAAGKWFWEENFSSSNLIANAINKKNFSFNQKMRTNLRQKCGFQEHDKVIGFVGRLCDVKNVLFFPDILRELKIFSDQYKMLIVGDGELAETLQKKFKQNKLETEVYFAGQQKDVGPWYSAMDAFILPSLYEGLPVAGIEAQACGLPCFVSDKVSNELNITGCVHYIPIHQGAKIWANTIYEILEKRRSRQGEFPEEYDIEIAVKNLEKKYLKLFSANCSR